jgi:hypothetical protein
MVIGDILKATPLYFSMETASTSIRERLDAGDALSTRQGSRFVAAIRAQR